MPEVVAYRTEVEYVGGQPNAGALVEVAWRDALLMTPYWATPDDAKAHAAAECHSVGIYVGVRDGTLVIAQSVGADHMGGVFAIPLAWLTRVEVLRQAPSPT